MDAVILLVVVGLLGVLLVVALYRESVERRHAHQRELRLRFEEELAARRIDALTRATVTAMRRVAREEGRRQVGLS